MIGGSLRPTHGSSNLHLVRVMAPDNDVVDEVQVFGLLMHQDVLHMLQSWKVFVMAMPSSE